MLHKNLVSIKKYRNIILFIFSTDRRAAANWFLFSFVYVFIFMLCIMGWAARERGERMLLKSINPIDPNS